MGAMEMSKAYGLTLPCLCCHPTLFVIVSVILLLVYPSLNACIG